MIGHRLIAPRHLAPTVVQLSGGVHLTVPPSGVVSIPHEVTMPGAQSIEHVEPPVRFIPTWLRELHQLGFQHLPQSGSTAERPASGRYEGEFFFDTTLGRPMWWSGNAWRGADGAPA